MTPNGRAKPKVTSHCQATRSTPLLCPTRRAIGGSGISPDTGAWPRCNRIASGVGVPADPACASLAPLLSYTNGGATKPVQLVSAARVPFENDDDATNDDRFEVVAVGEAYSD